MRADIKKGLPFEDGSFDGVYHSHLLEHLSRRKGEDLLDECRRVLSPGGIVRIVTPDLEQLANEYLATLTRARAGDPRAPADHEWILLQIFDQFARTRSGGEMVDYLSGPMVNEEFVRRSLGDDVIRASQPAPRPASKQRWDIRLKTFGRNVLNRISFGELIDTALFLRSGERHLWLYDSFSLGRVLENVGFRNPRVVTAFDSAIPGFADYDLDTDRGSVRKPDSLFMEAEKQA